MKSRSHVGVQNGRENLLKAGPGGLDNGIWPLGGVPRTAWEKKGLSSWHPSSFPGTLLPLLPGR